MRPFFFACSSCSFQAVVFVCDSLMISFCFPIKLLTEEWRRNGLDGREATGKPKLKIICAPVLSFMRIPCELEEEERTRQKLLQTQRASDGASSARTVRMLARTRRRARFQLQQLLFCVAGPTSFAA